MNQASKIPEDKKLNMQGNYEHRGTINVSDTETLSNIRTNIELGISQIVPGMPAPGNIKYASVLCGGPSMKDTLTLLEGEIDAGSQLVCVNGSASYARSKGFQPDAHVLIDGREFNKKFVEFVDPECVYFVASRCHPKVLERLMEEDARVFLFHTKQDIGEKEIFEEYYLGPEGRTWMSVAAGSTVGLNSIRLMYLLGYRRFIMHGMDSCLVKGEHHSYPQHENDHDSLVNMRIGERQFVCATWMASQIEDFFNMIHFQGDAYQIVVRGNGALAHMLEVGVAPERLDPKGD